MKILFCSDGTEAAEGALRYGALLAAGMRVEATLLAPLPQTGEAPHPGEPLRLAQDFLRAKGISAEVRCEPGRLVQSLAKVVIEQEIDLVIVGATRKRHGGPSWTGGRIYRLIDDVAAPVLLVINPPDAVERILVCSGILPRSDAAVQLATVLARSAGATIELVRVLPEAPAIYAPLFAWEREPQRLLESGDAVGRSLRRQRSLVEDQDIPCEIRFRYGNVVTELLEEVRGSDPGLMVLGSGHGWRRYIMGDIARDVVYRATRPVLIARPFLARNSKPLAV